MTRRRVLAAREFGQTWLCLVEDGRPVEIQLHSEDEPLHSGELRKARVASLAPAVDGAFLDAGLPADVFLPLSETGGERIGRGDELLVRITREAMDGKGYRASAELSLPGSLLVLLPRSEHHSVSRRITDDGERERLRGLIEDLCPPGCGAIARTAAKGVGRQALSDEIGRLQAEWERIRRRAEDTPAPGLVDSGPSPLTAFLLDRLASGELDLLLGDEALEREARGVVGGLAGLTGEIERHRGPLPLVEAFRLDRLVESLFSPVVPLPGGGRLIVEQTAALATIDVNSGRDMGSADLESTALKTNLEAAPEAARQIRLRGLAGLVVIDFIDMQQADSRRRVDQALSDALAADHERTRLLPLSPFCLAQISRRCRQPSLASRLAGGSAEGAAAMTPRASWQARRLLRSARTLLRGGAGRKVRVRAEEPVLALARSLAEGEPELPESRLQWLRGPQQVEVLPT